MAASKVQVGPGATVCESVVFAGDHAVSIGEGCVLGPNCRISASKGPIAIGRDNIIEENVVIE